MENQEKIYGIYPGSIADTQKIENLSEVDLYFAIDALGYHIWYCNHSMAHDRIPRIDLTEEQYALEYLVYQTRKFGIELPDAEIGKHIPRTESYSAWYEFYHNHFYKVLNQNQFEDFKQRKLNGQNVDEYMPTGNWKDSIALKRK